MKYIFKPKQCKECEVEFMPTTGAQLYCKECAVERRKIALAGYIKKYRESHKDKVRLWRRKWWHELTPEKKQAVTDKRMEKYWKDPELAREKNRKIYKNWVSTEQGKILHRISNYRRRVKEKSIIHDFTYDDWDKKLSSVKGVCQICHKRVGRKNLTLDHINPLSKVPKGTVYGINDVQPVCEHCNKSKKDN